MEEQTKAEKKPIDKKKFWLIVGGSIIGVAIIVGILLAFLLNYNSTAPNKVQITNQELTYFSINANDNYHGYRFVFESDSDSITVNSEENVISQNDIEGLVAGRRYQISACYLGQSEGANSDYSQPVTWICTFKLDRPELVYDNHTNIISWNPIENADFYNIIVISGSQTTTFEHVTTNNFDLNQVDGGIVKVYVSALSSNPYLYQSDFSTEFSTEFYKTFRNLVSATFDRETYILTIVGQQRLTQIDIQINYTWYSCTVTPSITDDQYVFQISLSDYASIISQSTQINVRPASLDEYNVYIDAPLSVEIV